MARIEVSRNKLGGTSAVREIHMVFHSLPNPAAPINQDFGLNPTDGEDFVRSSSSGEHTLKISYKRWRILSERLFYDSLFLEVFFFSCKLRHCSNSPFIRFSCPLSVGR
jgi:hypothetical protein